MKAKTLKEIVDILEDDAEVLFYDGVDVSSIYENAVFQPNSPEDTTLSLVLFGTKLDHDDYITSETSE